MELLIGLVVMEYFTAGRMGRRMRGEDNKLFTPYKLKFMVSIKLD